MERLINSRLSVIGITFREDDRGEKSNSHEYSRYYFQVMKVLTHQPSILTVWVILGDSGLEFILVEGLAQGIEDVDELVALHVTRLALVEHLEYLLHGCRGRGRRG